MGNACSRTEVTTTVTRKKVSAASGGAAESMRHKALRIEREQFQKADAGTTHSKIAHKHRDYP